MQRFIDWFFYFSIAFTAYCLARLFSATALFFIPLHICMPGLSPSFAGYSKPAFVAGKKGFFYHEGSEKAKAQEKKQEVLSLSGVVLKGTLVCSECGQSFALLEDARSGKTTVLAQGAQFKGYRLKKILSDKVILEADGKEVVLKLPKVKEYFPKESKENTFKISKKKVFEEISSGEFLKYMSLMPSKNPPGLKVTYVKPNSLIYRLGLRRGDIITNINDISIRTPEDSFSAFERLKNSDSVTITVLRNGSKVELRYELE
jgi:general secretion pathway protein C